MGHESSRVGQHCRSSLLNAAGYLAALLSLAWTSSSCLAQSDTTSPSSTTPEIKVERARDLLRLYGAEDQHLQSFVDDTEPDASQRDMLLRMFYAAGRFSLADLKHFSMKGPDWNSILAAPSSARGEAYVLRGTLKSLIAVPLDGDLAERLGITQFYRCELALGESQPTALVFAHLVPQAWFQGDAPRIPLGERVGAYGFFLQRVAGEKAGSSSPLFVTKRLAWYPPTVLGEYEADAGLLDLVRNNTHMLDTEAPCFFDMLAAMGRAASLQLLRLAPEDTPVEKLFPHRETKTKKLIEPEVQRGELVTLTGTATRAVRVRVEDPQTIAAYGFDHYYEIDLANNDARGNPVVFCVRQLPRGMPSGERVAVDVRIAGFFYKTWTYRIHDHRSEATVKDRLQIAPLLIGREPLMLAPPAGTNPYTHMWVGVLFALATAGAWFGVAYFTRQDDRSRRQLIERHLTTADAPLDAQELSKIDAGEVHFRDYHEQQPLLEAEGQDRRLETGDWRPETRDRRLETGS